MFSLQIVQKPSFDIDENTLDEICKIISENILYPQNGTLNIVFIDHESIQNLNKKYRNIDKVTDVLSFHYHAEFSGLYPKDIAGELVFCEERVISQGQEYGLGTEKEFYKLLIHSILHILGFDHETDEEYEEMKKWEEIIGEKAFS